MTHLSHYSEGEWVSGKVLARGLPHDHTARGRVTETVNRSCRVLVAVLIAVATSAARAEAHEGWGIVVDATGQVYFGDIPANIIWKITARGDVERAAVGKHSHALVLDSAGNVYGSNPHLTLPIRSVWRLTPTGQLTDLIPPTDNFPLGLQSFTIDAAGTIYSVNAWNAQAPTIVLLKRSTQGEVAALAGSTVGQADGKGSDVKFLGIDGMAWGADGVLYVTDGPYVRRVSQDGTVTTLGDGAITERRWDEDLLGIALDANADVYVADHANRRIRKITGDGTVSTVLSTGFLWAPTGVTMTPDGLYVLEHLRMPLAILGDVAVGPYLRVRKVSRDGEVTVLARIWGRRSLAVSAVVVAILGLIALRQMRTRG